MRAAQHLHFCRTWLPRQRPLNDRGAKFRLFIYSFSSTNRANLVKIGPVDFQIIGATEIAKKETTAEHRPLARF